MRNLFFLFFILAAFSSCNKENSLSSSASADNHESQINCEELTIESYSYYGVYHNNALDNFYYNFEVDTTISNYNDAIDYISNFNVSFLLEQLSGEGSAETILSEYENNEWLVDVNMAYDTLFGSSSSNVYLLLENLSSLEIIDIFEYNILHRISECCELNYNQSISNSDFKDSIDYFIGLWNENDYTTCSNTGFLSAYVLSIANYSVEWWEDHPEANEKVAPWVGADAVGAAIGAGSGAIGSYWSTGQVQWRAVGVGAVTGAVSGSTGVVGKAGKLISKFFS